jgi:hypothetical protein
LSSATQSFALCLQATWRLVALLVLAHWLLCTPVSVTRCTDLDGLLQMFCMLRAVDYARTRLANDSKSAKKGGGERQFNGLVDVYRCAAVVCATADTPTPPCTDLVFCRKTLATDGIVGLYRGFVISCVGIVVYRGLYFGA